MGGRGLSPIQPSPIQPYSPSILANFKQQLVAHIIYLDNITINGILGLYQTTNWSGIDAKSIL